MKRFLRAALTLVIIAGCIAVLWPAGQWAYGTWKQYSLRAAWRAAEERYAKDKQLLSLKTAATHSTLPQKKPTPAKARQEHSSSLAHQKSTPTPRRSQWLPTRLIIPDIDLDTIVVQGVDDASLRDGPGHDPASALPGEQGNCVIAGHRNAYGWWFYHLGELGTGAYIQLRTPEKTFTYQLASTRVLQDHDTWVLQPPGPHAAPRLTLYTCALPHGSKRIVVVANLVKSNPRFQ